MRAEIQRRHEAAATIEERVFAGTPAECAACHTDAHRGAFDGFENEAGCAHCHRPSEFREYDEGAFEHGGWTGFRLEGAHARAECESCHVPWPLPGGGEAVRYKPLGTECVDCHDPEFLEREQHAAPRPRTQNVGLSPRGGGR